MNLGSNPAEIPLNRASDGASVPLLRFGEFELDRQQWQLRGCGQVIPIRRKTFDLLLYLAEARPRVVSKDELLTALWPNQFVDENNLSQQISVLRKALAPNGSGAIVETVPGRGYRFAVPVEEMTVAQPPRPDRAAAATESTTQVQAEPAADAAEKAPKTPSWKPLLAAALAAVALGAAAWLGWHRWENRSTGEALQVVLLPLFGGTGDAVLDRALDDALRIDLQQSPLVTLVSSGKVNATLQQMKRAPADLARPEIQQELCERTNSQAVVHVGLARDGQKFLLTGNADACADGATLAGVRQTAARIDDLPEALDGITNTLRRRLGESRGSVARFNTRLPDTPYADTPSLEALKAVSESNRLADKGDLTGSINLLRRAISYDPNYANAYLDLAASYTTRFDNADARQAIEKAYALRDSVSPLMKLRITSLYETIVTRDLYASERNWTSWTQLYPRSVSAWNGLSIVQAQLGDRVGGIASAARALALRPDNSDLLSNVVEQQTAYGDYKAALGSCRRGLEQGLDTEKLRFDLLRLAYAMGDPTLLKEQRRWLAEHPESPLLLFQEAEIAATEGRFADALRFGSQSAAIYQEQGLPAVAGTLNKALAKDLVEAGDQKEAAPLFNAQPLDPADGEDALVLAMLGRFADGERLLHDRLAASPDDTLWKLWYGPAVRAESAAAAGRVRDAVALLEPTRALDGRDNGAAWVRAQMLLRADKPQNAEREFRGILARIHNDPTAPTSSVTWLGLARALARQGKRGEAADAYRHFLAVWAHADPAAELLKAARGELADLVPAS